MDRRTLLLVARQAITDTVVRGVFPETTVPPGRVAEPGAAFVTLRYQGCLRGCMGRTDHRLPLAETVVQCAITAALRDPRFTPIEAGEIDSLEIELSVLSQLRPARHGEIEAGTHGVLIDCAGRRGLLLPQVARERAWSAERLLEETCRKAGLDPDAWRRTDATLFAFTAEIISELADDVAARDASYSSSTKSPT